MPRSKIYLLLVFLALVSCRKKELPKPTTGSPVFYFKGTVNNESLNINAGVNNYYLFTSYTLHSDKIYLLGGELKDQDCSSGCRNVLTISVADAKRRIATNIDDISNVLKPNGYKYYASDHVLDDTTKVFLFKAASGYQSYLWEFGDGTTSALPTAEHIYTKPGLYNVCLTIKGDDCVKTMCNWINTNTLPAEDLTFDYTISGSAVNLTAPTGWNTYFWSLSDSTIGSTNTVFHEYKDQGVYDVCLSATKGGQVKTFCREIKIPGSFNCTADWTYSSTLSINPVKDSLLSKIIIEWTDANGIKYNSSLGKQPPASYFTIKNGNTYIENANSEKTYKFSCVFDVMVFEENHPSRSLHLTSSECNWAVAYP